MTRHKHVSDRYLRIGFLSHNCHLDPTELLPLKARRNAELTSNFGAKKSLKLMTKKSHKIVTLSVIYMATSAIAASAAILPGMEGAVLDPTPINPIGDFSPQTSTSNYNDMDALLGFRVLAGTGSGLEGIIDLGPVTQFNHTFTLSLGNIGTFMTNNFGTDWYTRSTSGQSGKTDIQWAVVATDNSTNFTNDLWSTRNPAVRSTPWTRAANQSEASNDIAAVGSQYSGQTIDSNTTSAIKESSSNANSWTQYQPGGGHSGGISFQFFNPTDEGNTNSVLAFDSVPEGTGSGTQLGSFSWANDGTLTFTAVPEPSTYAMLASGGVLLGGLMFLRRRRAACA